MPLYRSILFIHLFLAATWTGAHMANLYLAATARSARDPLAHALASRRLLLRLEMPLMTLVPIFGIILSVMQPIYWSQAWLHIKVGLVVVLLIVMVLASLQSKRLVAALESGDLDAVSKYQRAYLTYRVVGAVIFVAIFVLVAFRFGA